MKFTGVYDREFEEIVQKKHLEIVQKLETYGPAMDKWGDLSALLHTAYTVEINKRMSTCGGYAKTDRRNMALVKLNYRLHRQNMSELPSTYAHELAHIVANVIYDRNVKHGREWKRLMQYLGEDDSRLHEMDISAFRARRQKIRYEYTCLCRKWQLTKHKHDIASRHLGDYGTRCYSCPKCKGKLYYAQGPIKV